MSVMTAVSAAGVPFVTTLRSRQEIVQVPGPDGPRLTVRVELPEQWETIAFSVPAGLPVLTFKRAALAQFGLGHDLPEDYILKLRGIAVLDEGASVADSGARDGSTYLLTYRRRRPVR